MSIANRYTPSHPAGQACMYALDFSNLLPLGVGIAAGSLVIEENSVPPTANADFTQGPVEVSGRRLYAQLSGGVAATDYRLNWQAEDSLGNAWIRTCLLLCAQTS